MRSAQKWLGILAAAALLVGSAAPAAAGASDGTTLQANRLHDAAFTALPMGSITAQGYLKTQLLLQKDGLTGHLEELSPSLQNNAWFGGTGDAWERGPYHVRGLVALAYTLDDTDLKAQAQKWIDWTLASQRENGSFGPSGTDLWARILMLQAVRDYGEATDDPRVMPFFDRFLRYELKTLLKTPVDPDSWAAQRIGDNVDIALWYYNKTKADFALDLIHLLYRQGTDWESVYRTGDFKRTPMITHIVNQQQSFKLLPLAYLAGCGDHLKEIYAQGVSTYDRLSGRADGANNGDEYMRDNSTVAGGETCAVVERMLSDEIALRALGDAAIADRLERLAFNALPTTTNEDITAQTYFSLINQTEVTLGYHGFTSDGGDRLLYGVPGGYPCCIHNFSMGWPKYISSLWAKTADDGIAALVYGPSAVTATVGRDNVPLTVEERTNYPFEESVTFALTLEKPQTFGFTLRIPQWCSAPQIRINGKAYTADLPAGEYVTIRREWRTGDEVTVSLPMPLRLLGGENGSVSVQRGPLTYALQIGEQWNALPNDYDEQIVQGLDGQRKTILAYAVREDFPSSDDPRFPTYEVLGTTPWNYALILDHDALERTLTFEGLSGDLPAQPFSSQNAPVRIRAKAQRLSSWTRDAQNGTASPVPQSPVQTDAPVEDVTLVPMGCARLRVACLPWSGSGTPRLHPVQKNEQAIAFTGLPAAERFALTYQNPTGRAIAATLFVNGTAAKQVVFATDGGRLVLRTPDLSPTQNNQIALVYHDPAAGQIAAPVLSALTDQNGTISLEAEDGILTAAAVYADTPSASGGRFVGDIDRVGASIRWEHVMTDEDAVYDVQIHYATGLAPAYHTLRIDGKDDYRVDYQIGTSWSTFGPEQYVTIRIPLAAGTHRLELFKPAEDASFAQIDRLVLVPLDRTVYEAEDADLTGCQILSTPTASGGRYVANIDDVGAGLTFPAVEAEEAGWYRLTARYATGLTPAFLTVTVNGADAGRLMFDRATNWSEFSDEQAVSLTVWLDAGKNTVALTKTEQNASFVQLDRIALTPLGDRLLLEAEDAATDARLTDSTSASGGRYVGGIDRVGQYVEFSADLPAGEDPTAYQLRIYYAALQPSSHALYVNGQKIQTVSYNQTSGWGVFDQNRYVALILPLHSGRNTIRLVKEADDKNFAEIDRIELRRATAQMMTKKVMEITRPDILWADKGTAPNALALPDTVACRLEDGTTAEIAVQWDLSAYHPDLPYAQTILGTLAPGTGISDSCALIAAVQVFSSTLLQDLDGGGSDAPAPSPTDPEQPDPSHPDPDPQDPAPTDGSPTTGLADTLLPAAVIAAAAAVGCALIAKARKAGRRPSSTE